jgi:hypothetical protein
MYGYDEAKKDFSDVFYGWDIGMPLLMSQCLKSGMMNELGMQKVFLV